MLLFCWFLCRERERTVPKDEAEAFASSVGGTLIDTSAKVGKGVESAFLHIARSIVSSKVNVHMAAPAYGYQPARRGGNIQVVDERRPTRPKEPDCC